MTRTRILSAMVLLAVGGCALQPDPDAPPPPRDWADKQILMVSPKPTVNLDARPGSEGVRFQAYFFMADKGKPVAVSGSLNVLMFEGREKAEAVGRVEPYKVWEFSPAELPDHLVRTRWGWAYDLTLIWGLKAPQRPLVTIIGIYKSPDGRQLVSEPIIIPIGPS